ncbi:MAG: Hsp20/alpha crystallin family protein [Leptospiraceae bacterium]|nr:Hsp20/alpha crystallin family protein [Leptospiraceae bacterium]
MNNLANKEEKNIQAEKVKKERIITPHSNIYESKDSILIALDIPGVEEKDLEINFEKDQLLIKGTTSFPENDSSTVYKEFSLGTYIKKYTIQKPVDIENTEATLKNGRLTIKINKIVPQVKKIQVKTI